MNLYDRIVINYDILILLSLLVNLIICGICACRLGKMTGVRPRVRVQYIGLMVISFGNAFAPVFFRQWPNFMGFLFTAWVCVMLWLDGYQWRKGPPSGSTIHGDL